MFMDKERGKHILQILKALTAKHGGDTAKAAGELTAKLGDMWRDELRKCGMGEHVPMEEMAPDGQDQAEEFYKKVGKLLESTGYGSQEDVKNPMPKPGESMPGFKSKPSEEGKEDEEEEEGEEDIKGRYIKIILKG